MVLRSRIAVLLGAVGLSVCAACSTTAATDPGAASPAAAGSTATSPTGSTAGSASLVPTGLPTATGEVGAASLQVPDANADAPFDQPRTVAIPAGWTMSVWARVEGARLAVWTPDGKLLVSRPESGDIVVLTPQGDGVPEQHTLVDGLTQPHGMTFVQNTLYVAESDQVRTYRYADGAVSDSTVIIPDLPDASTSELRGRYAHALKSVVVGADGSVYVSVGSTGNVTPEDRDADPQRATVLRWAPDTRTLSVFARGVRNGTGLAVDPDGAVWTAVNNRDQMPVPYHRDVDGDGSDDYGKVIASYVRDHPLEPVAKLSAGRDLGWPYCYPDPTGESDPEGTPSFTDRPFVPDIQTNADQSKLDCSTLPRIEQGLPAHSAPLGMVFTTLPAPFGTGAVIASHGSWNRTPPQSPNVSFFSWSKGELGAGTTLVGGFQNADGSRWGRVVGVAPGPDKSLYITDDEAGAVYRLTPG